MFGLEFLILGVIIVLIVRAVTKRRSITGESAAVVVRRSFQYLGLFVSLALAGFGVAGMLEAVFASEGAITSDTALIARSVAFLVVGVPVFTGLALFTRRQLESDPAETRSLVWTAYLTIVTIGSLIGVVVSGSILLGEALRGDGLATVALIHLVVWGTVWATHWRICTGVTDQARLQIARLLGSLVGLGVSLTAGSIAVGMVFVRIYDELTNLAVVDAGWDRVAGPVAMLIVAGMVWSWYWIHASRRDTPSPLWMAYVLLAGVLTGVVMTASGVGTMLFLVFEWLFTDPAEAADSFFEGVPMALGVVAVGGASWAYHRSVLPPVAAGRTEVHRAYDYILSGVGVVTTAGGIATLLVAGLRSIAGVEATDTSGALLATALTLLVVGLPIWWRHWSRIQRELHADPETYALSLSRRIYLPVVVGVSCLTALASLIVTIYALVQNVLDERSIGVITDAIAVPIAIVITAATVAAYHGSALWRDRGTLAALAPKKGVREVILVTENGTAVIDAITDAHIRVSRLHAAAPVMVAPSVDEVMDTLGNETHDRVVVLTRGDLYDVVPID